MICQFLEREYIMYASMHINAQLQVCVFAKLAPNFIYICF